MPTSSHFSSEVDERCAKGGAIGVKENVCEDGKGGDPENRFDLVDSSVTRCLLSSTLLLRFEDVILDLTCIGRRFFMMLV